MEKLSINPESLRSPKGTPSSSRANPATVSRGIQALFSAYRSADFADPEGFVAQLGTILSEFSDEVVVYVTSPKTGIQRRSKWPPTISEVLEACEDHQDYLRKMSERRRPIAQRIEAPSTSTRPPGYLANIHVPETHPRYARLAAWTEAADPKLWKFGPSSTGVAGLWVALNIWQDGIQAPARPQTTPRDLTLTPETRAVMADRIEPESSEDAA